MNIGFDAKRAFHNRSGLGHFSRTLIRLLSAHYPEHRYYLFNPKPSTAFTINGDNIREVRPQNFFHKLFSAAWRSSWVTKDLQRMKIDLYHGVSHEIPLGIQKTGVRSVVTIHDLIHERHPEQYNPIDVKIYSRKFRYACNHADRIMAISQQTKQDIIDFYRIAPEKIAVCYQSCDPAFAVPAGEEKKTMIRAKYGLPREFFLYVGAIIERKNLLNICKAFFLLRNDLNIPLVVVGDGGKYKQQVKDYIRQQGLEDKILFLSEKKNSAFIPLEDFPALYQAAIAMIYPSFFEGFGAPVLEALWSRVPVITSNTSCLPEVGGPGAYYVSPENAEEIAGGILKIYTDKALVADMKEKGWQHALKFSPDQYVSSVMELYKSIC